MDNVQFLIYRSAEDDVHVQPVIKDDTIWLTQKSMSELFGVDRTVISRHLKNIFEEGKLNSEVVCAFFALPIIS